MFCNNCGSKLPDGSRFCSVCGTRLVDLEPSVTESKPASNFGYAEDVRTDADRSESYDNAAARVSFDWSNVIEEPVKKVVPEVRSPWVEPVVEERPAVEKPALDHRRTMSFIEILKQEREEKLKAAEQEAQAVTSRPEAVPDYSAFENAPQMYNDIAKNVEAPLYEEPSFEEPAFEEPKYEGRPFGFETADLSDFEPPLHTLAEEAATADPLFETSNLFKDIDEPVIPTIEVEAPASLGENLNVEDFYNQTMDFGAAEPGNLAAELDAILNAGAGRVSRAERNAAADEEEYAEEIEAPAEEQIEEQIEAPAEVPEVEIPELIEEAPVFEYAEEPQFEAPLTEELNFDEEIFAPADSVEITPIIETEEIEEAEEEAPVLIFDESMFAPANTVDEPIAAPEFEPPIIEEAPAFEEPVEVFEEAAAVFEEPAPVFEEPVAVAPAADEESEIDELKKRLAMLMSDEPEQKEEPASTEDDEMFEPQVEVSDAISLDDLEKELFGDEAPEDIEVEATKKIDKFYTLYKKNEEFQRLLEEEYDKLKEADESQPKDAAEKTEESAEKPAEAAADEAAVEAKPEKKEKKAKKEKKEKKAKKSEDDVEESKGSGILTVLAVIIAVLLVVLLGVILVLNFAPDSGIAMTIDSLIENVASYFSDAGLTDKISLL